MILPKPTMAAMVILAVLLGVVLIARHALDRPKATPAAWAILNGESQSQAIATAESHDRDLVADEAAAGAMWARSHRATDPAECPLDPPAFRRGCGAFVAAHPR